MEKLPETLREQVYKANLMDIGYNVLHPKANIYDQQSGRHIIVPYSSLTNKYRAFLHDIIIESKLTDAEKRSYWYQPKYVSQIIYGTVEFWSDLLVLNRCVNIAQFKPETLKYYDPERFKPLLNELMILENMSA